ncbi:hypothetical protein RN001_009221 [Aquatica leii]|uniref:Cytochrome P450 n=1 Tax=Aquatica leii TaxID=1421715 RepID=A0AAN7NZA5_9COLE|nr:hypothetical protein RN001_009221 [Aquatica leii]
MWVLVISACICGLLLYYKLCSPLKYWSEKNVPHPTPSLIVGNLGPAVTKKETFNKLLQKICLKYDNHRYFGFYQFSKPSLVILDRKLIKEIFIKSFDHFTDHDDFLPKGTDTFWKKGLFSRKGEDWHDMRTTLSPAFTSRKMKAMFHLVTECSERFVNYYVKKGATISLEVMDFFTKFDNDVIASCTFGINCDSLENENNEFHVMAKEAFTFTGLKSLKFFGNALSPTISRLFRVKMFSDEVRDFFMRVTKETISYREKTGLCRPDVMHLLIEAQKGRLKDEDEDNDDDKAISGFVRIDKSYSMKRNHSKKIPLTDEDIAGQALIFFFGSYDTVSLALSHTVYELVANPNVQEKLIKEIDYTLNECNSKITYEALFQMKYLDMVISETLRLWAPPPTLDRICVKPFVIEPTLPNEKPLLIEPGVEVIVPVYAWHRNPKYFKNPDKFDPERFSDKNKESIKSFTYFPFGIGPRHCIGIRFALLVMKIMMVNLLTKFQIIPTEKTVIPFEQSKNSLLLRSMHGYWFGLKPRTKI